MAAFRAGDLLKRSVRNEQTRRPRPSPRTVRRILAEGGTPTRVGRRYPAYADPIVVFDTYDWRSVIENSIFKEGKHPWHLRRFPQRTHEAVVVHCHCTLAVMALCTAFRLWQAQGARDASPLAAPVAPASRKRTAIG